MGDSAVSQVTQQQMGTEASGLEIELHSSYRTNLVECTMLSSQAVL